LKRNGTVIINARQTHRREFVRLFNQFSGKYHKWQIWQDFIFCAATALSQPLDFRPKREDEYLRTIGKYTKQEQDLFPQMLGEIVLALEEEGMVDLLGELYMQLEMHNKWRGQFFTPMPVAELMGKVIGTDIAGLVEEKGYISVNEPSCGSGVMLISFCKTALEQKVNFQQKILFVAQDIDPLVAQMCFIQMSLYGMAGYVIVGNSLLQNRDEWDYWYTPMYFSDMWTWRRKFQKLKALMNVESSEIEAVTETPPITEEYDVVLEEGKDGQFMFAF
jgi:hypothetical protein